LFAVSKLDSWQNANKKYRNIVGKILQRTYQAPIVQFEDIRMQLNRACMLHKRW